MEFREIVATRHVYSAQHLAQQRNHNVTIQIVGEKDWHYSPGLGWNLLGSHGREWTLINYVAGSPDAARQS
jgi:hypothetical protein